MTEIRFESDLLNYIIKHGYQPGDRLPTISELQETEKLGISVSKVREQLEVARALGLVDVRSKTGTHLKEFSFTPAVRLSLFFALATDIGYFEQFSELRTHIEMAFWIEACAQLTDADKIELRGYVDSARAKLHDIRVRIPFEEHRAFHLTIFKHLDNPFVIGLLEAYWDAYEAVELNRYAEYGYHTQVWDYHERILNAICAGDYGAAQEAFMQHTRLLHHQPRMQDMENGEESSLESKVTE